MTVAELIELLKKENPNAVVVYNFSDDINDYGYYEVDCNIHTVSANGDLVTLL